MLIAELNTSKEELMNISHNDTEALNNIRLCDLNENNKKIYEAIKTKIKLNL